MNGESLIREAQDFFNEMEAALEVTKQNALCEWRRGARFHIAGYAVRGLEVPLNWIMGDLLDPKGAHGQGERFLRTFLEQCMSDLPVYELQKWRVVQSHRTRLGRCVDLAIFGQSEVAIYIESKPWAREGMDQLEDYAIDLLTLGHTKKRLVFLPGVVDREPTTLTESTRHRLGDNNFRLIPFQYSGGQASIVRWLERCAEICEAENVRVFLNDLASYLRMQFPGSEISMSTDPFVSKAMPLVRSRKAYMEIVLRLGESMPQLKRTIAESFRQELSAALRQANPDWSIDNPFKSFDRYERLSLRRKAWPAGWGIYMAAEDRDFQNFSIGFYCPISKVEPDAHLATDKCRVISRSALEAPLLAIGHAVRPPSDWCPVWCWLPDPFKTWGVEGFLILAGLEKMPDGCTAIETFVDWFKRLADALGRKVDDVLAENT